MSGRSFHGVVRSGHKEDAVELPFNPTELWGVVPRSFAPGRRGIAVSARVDGKSFSTQVVARSGKHWLLVPPEVEATSGLAAGVEVEVEPEATSPSRR